MNWKSILGLKVIGMVVTLVLTVTIPVGYVAATENHFGHFIIDPVKTDAGYVSGTIIDLSQICWVDYVNRLTGIKTCSPILKGEVGKEVRVYRGIPYAAPPVGDLRWKPPQPVTPWEGIRECTVYPKMAPQTYPTSFFYGNIQESGISEDILYLNVVTPAKRDNERLPVMVWFHGGGLTAGSNSTHNYNTASLPNHGVVIVTVQHRLGPIGYMAHPELTTESPNHASGNYGDLDLIAALYWVKKNIAAFGGNPHRVTIFGHSGGGSKVNWLLASPLAKGLFHRAICQAGFSTGGTPLATAEQQGLNLMAKLGVSSLAEMRAKTWQEIITAVNSLPSTSYLTNHTVDGWSLTDTIANIFREGKNHDVPYIVGNAGGEARPASMAQLLLTMSGQQRSHIYTYIYTQVPPNWIPYGQYGWHGSEVSAEFGNENYLPLFIGALVPSTLPYDSGVDDRDFWVSEFMMTMLAKFAATGNPSVKHMGVYWPAYDSRDQYLDIGYPPLIQSGYSTTQAPQPPR